MNEDAAGAVTDPHDRRHLLIRRVLKEPQIDRFAFTRAEMAERVRHLAVAHPSFGLTFGIEGWFWPEGETAPARLAAMVLARQIEHDAIKPAPEFRHLSWRAAAYEGAQKRLLNDLFGDTCILYQRRCQLEGGTAECRDHGLHPYLFPPIHLPILSPGSCSRSEEPLPSALRWHRR